MYAKLANVCKISSVPFSIDWNWKYSVSENMEMEAVSIDLDVHGSVHRNIKLIERTNKMRPCSRIYYSNVS